MTASAPGVLGRRLAPLDGVRAIAVAAVLAHHAKYPWAEGGYIGVDVFFVLSGYLITGVLLSTHRSWWGYRRFLGRRAIRLVPTLVVAMAGVTLVALATGMNAPVAACGGASLGYLMNLPFVADWHCPAMWHITWSLAAEQQFYLLWPLLLWVLAIGSRRLLARVRPSGPRAEAYSEAARRVGPRTLRLAALGALGFYLLSIAWQVVLRAEGDSSIGRLVFFPDGRCLVLLLGCALALWRASRSPAARGVALRARYVDLLVLGALATLVLCVVAGDDGPGLGDLWPLLAAAVASGVLVWAAAHAGETSLAGRLLGARPLVWLGRVSYSLYLWHEVGYRLAEQVSAPRTVTVEVLRIVLALGLAAASYHLVEQPVQRWWLSRGAERRADEKVLVAAAS